jgi:hypothetical protein
MFFRKTNKFLPDPVSLRHSDDVRLRSDPFTKEQKRFRGDAESSKYLNNT